MSLQDSIPITTLERVVSDDFNDESDLNNRTIAEFEKCFCRLEAMGGIPSHLTRGHVASGLFLQLSLGAPVLSTGVLFQDSVAAVPPLVPAPDTFDSPTFRSGLNLTTMALADPWAGVDMWYLLQARVEHVVALLEARDIYDPTTQTFAPGAPIDKRYESRVVTAWKAGGAALIPAPDAGYAPIAALYRPAGGGAIANADVVQLAIQLDDLVPLLSDQYANHRTCKRFRSDSGAPTLATFSLSAEIDGLRLYAHSESGAAIRTAPFIDSAFAASMAVDGLWWYVYLSHGTNIVPSNVYGVTVDHRGLLIASRIPPTDLGRNSAALNAPAPISQVVAAGTAALVGIFRSSGVGSDIHPISIAENGDGFVDKQQFSFAAPGDKLFPMTQANTFQNGAHDLQTTGPGGNEDVPLGVQLKCYFEMTRLDVTALGLAANMLLSLPSAATRRVVLGFRDFHSPVEFELHPVNGSTVGQSTVTFTVTCLDTTGGAIAWNAANVQNNEFVAGIYGVRI